MKKHLFLLLCLYTSLHTYGQKAYKLQSPDGNIQVSISLSDKIYYDVTYQQDTLLKQCNLQMELSNQELGNAPKLAGVNKKSVDESLKPVIPLKYSTVANKYNQLLMKFKGDYSVEFRAFNDGIAYRFITNKKGMIEVNNETFQVNFPENYLLHVQHPGGFKTAYEKNTNI